MRRLLLFVLIAGLATIAPALIAQQAAPPQGATPPEQSEPGVRTFEGDLVQVDATAKSITVKATAPDREMVFYYDDQTQVVGESEGVQGLSGKTGTSLKVSYREQRGTSRATKIEVMPKKV